MIPTYGPGRPSRKLASVRKAEQLRYLFLVNEHEIIRSLIESALEAGLQASDACRLGLGVYKELDVLARDADLNVLDETAMVDIRLYCRAILRSGSTFAAFEIASRAIQCWREATASVEALRTEWDREIVTRRLKMQRVRQRAAEKGRAKRAAMELELRGGKDEPRSN